MNINPCPICGHPYCIHLADMEPGVKHPAVCSKEGCDCVLPEWIDAPGIMTHNGACQWDAYEPDPENPGVWKGVGGGEWRREYTSSLLKRNTPVFTLTRRQVDEVKSRVKDDA